VVALMFDLLGGMAPSCSGRRRRLLQRRHVRRVSPTLVNKRDVGSREDDGRINVDVLEGREPGLLAVMIP